MSGGRESPPSQSSPVKGEGVFESLGGLFVAVVGDAVVEGGPGEEGALDANGELADALKGFHVADLVEFVVGEFLAAEEAAEELGEFFGFGQGLVLHEDGEDGGGCLADGAALTVEGDGLYFLVGVEVEAEDHFVAAEGVEASGGDVGVGDFAMVSGVAVVVEDDFLVEVVKLGWVHLLHG